jgi:Pyruvate/2-oxoacid:ferredoxin oxidoreductase gamma subunit
MGVEHYRLSKEPHRVRRRYGTPDALVMMRQAEAQEGVRLANDVVLVLRGDLVAIRIAATEKVIAVLKEKEKFTCIEPWREPHQQNIFSILLGSGDFHIPEPKSLIAENGDVKFYYEHDVVRIEINKAANAVHAYDLLYGFLVDGAACRASISEKDTYITIEAKKLQDPPDPAYT